MIDLRLCKGEQCKADTAMRGEKRMNMKAKRITVILAAVVLSAVLAFLLLPRHYEMIPLTDGLRFGMTPAEVRAVYGAPEAAEERNASPMQFCTYHAVLNGVPAEYHFRFTRVGLHYELDSMNVHFRSDEVSELAESVQKQLRSAYETIDGYYEENIETGFVCGINHGAASVSCEVQTSSSGVSVFLTRVY